MAHFSFAMTPTRGAFANRRLQWMMAVGFRCLLQREIATRWLITIGREICTRVAEPLENTGIMPERLESSIEASLLFFLLHGGQLHTPLQERSPQTVCVATIEEPSSARHLPVPWIALPANDLMSINPFCVRSNLVPIGPFGGERTPRAGVYSAVIEPSYASAGSRAEKLECLRELVAQHGHDRSGVPAHAHLRAEDADRRAGADLAPPRARRGGAVARSRQLARDAILRSISRIEPSLTKWRGARRALLHGHRDRAPLAEPGPLADPDLRGRGERDWQRHRESGRDDHLRAGHLRHVRRERRGRANLHHDRRPHAGRRVRRDPHLQGYRRPVHLN